MTKKKTEPIGNIWLEKAKIYAGKETYFNELELQGIQAFAMLALAEETQTQNMLAYLAMMPLPPEAKEVEIEIRKRLGLSE